MSDPKFSVGEDVWLVSTIRPEVNGPTVVREVLHDYLTCDSCNSRTAPAYRLDVPDRGYGWCECTIRKRPPPDEEYDRFMDRLNLTDKTPEKVE